MRNLCNVFTNVAYNIPNGIADSKNAEEQQETREVPAVPLEHEVERLWIEHRSK